MGSRRPSPRSDVRLQKFLADCGLGSRRRCEDLIRGGLVRVNDRPVTEQGTRVDPGADSVTVNGEAVLPESRVHILLNKPPGVLCTSRDPQGRVIFRDLLKDLPQRVYTVGRLDLTSEGLLLVTNDGDLAHRLMHPRHHVPKTYLVWVDAEIPATDIARLERGIASEGDRLRLRSIERAGGQVPCYRMILTEGRKRQIRRMLQGVGRRVRRLRRVALGPLRLGALEPGAWRPLSHEELRKLRAYMARSTKCSRM